MKRIIYMLTSIVVIFVGCQTEPMNEPLMSDESTTFDAMTEAFVSQTKTTMTDDGHVEWSEEDQIAIFQGRLQADKFQLEETSVGKTRGVFCYVSDSVEEDGKSNNTSNEVGWGTNIALYPYQEDLSCFPFFNGSKLESFTISNIIFPAIQGYVANSFSFDTSPMVALADGKDNHNLKFKNICGILKLPLKGSRTIMNIRVIGKGEEVLAGTAMVTAYLDGSEPDVEMAEDGETIVTLNCGKGVRLNSEIATVFRITLPPIPFKDGLDILITDSDGCEEVISLSQVNFIKRSMILTVPEIAIDEPVLGGDAVDLSQMMTANCYVISSAGSYKFKAVKGNTNESVGEAATAEVLWETFGTDAIPNVGDVVSRVSYCDGYITFSTPHVYKEGNAVIAVKDQNGTILWSWHIWLTDRPEEQVYHYNTGIMMDRNLGATSAIPGDVGALGLLYQWGRKDPFLGASSINNNTLAESTLVWPQPVSSERFTGTVEYAVANPTTYILFNNNNVDWFYSDDMTTDDSRWTTLENGKSMYDPCPAGWRVPDGGGYGVWSKSAGFAFGYFDYPFNNTNKGMNFSGEFGNSEMIWYPASGRRSYDCGELCGVGESGHCYSATPDDNNAFIMTVTSWGDVRLESSYYRAGGYSVRCIKDGVVAKEGLSSMGTANCYIVSEPGTYKFFMVKGNTEESIGAVSSVEVLWETFGTDTIPNKGDIISSVSHDDGYVTFTVPEIYKEGNAVIAAKDQSGTILWSWHIWLTDQPEEQVYYKGSGTMMDRNLGAVSATIGDVGALGLMYQWGRKDPFLGSSSIKNGVVAKSTINWPDVVESDENNGTISYVVEHPTTFVKDNRDNGDWYYTGDSSTDNTRWRTPIGTKSMYDPCPVGWKVPDGGVHGVWSKACGVSGWYETSLYDRKNAGVNFSGEFGSSEVIWYPASGVIESALSSIEYVGHAGFYWSASATQYAVYMMTFVGNSCVVKPSLSIHYNACACSVRCVKE